MSEEIQDAPQHEPATTGLGTPNLGVKKDFDPENSDEGYVRFFIGTSRQQAERLEKLLELFLSYSEAKENKVAPAEIAARHEEYQSFIKSDFPNQSEDEAGMLALSYYNFLDTFVESAFFRNRKNNKPGLSNTSLTASGDTTSDIRPLRPASGGKHAMRDAMRRTHRRQDDLPENILILLRNSFMTIQIRRPETLDYARLISDIQSEIRGYVRALNGNSLTLSRISIIRVVWRFIADRIVKCSVKDTQNFSELATSVLLSDIGAIAMALVTAISPKGVNVMFEHHDQNCGWAGNKVMDPSLAVWIDDEHATDNQKEVWNQLLNGLGTYSREEIEKLQAESKHGVDTKIYSADKTSYCEVATPTLATAFRTFDAFVERITPAMSDLRNNTLDDRKYQQDLESLISSVGGAEWLHWVDKYVSLPEEGTDDKPVVFERNSDPIEFCYGIFDVLDDDQAMTNALVSFVRNNAPRMTYTVIGYPNAVCEGCKRLANETSVGGITPFDPLMNFFTHTQLTQTIKAMRNQNASSSAL